MSPAMRAAGAPAVTDLPEIGDPIALRDASGLLYTSRVEDLVGQSVTVARPVDLRAAVEYDLGLALDIVWTKESGIHVVPGRLSGTSVERNLRLWHLKITGEGWTEQRRDYVRVPLEGRLLITPITDGAGFVGGDPGAGDSAGGTVEGRFVDLSEVAAQCAVGVSGDDRRIAVGNAVRCAFALEGDEFDIDGKVGIVRPGSTARESRVVIVFDHSRATADALRKHLFKAQIALRRTHQQ